MEEEIIIVIKPKQARAIPKVYTFESRKAAAEFLRDHKLDSEQG